MRRGETINQPVFVVVGAGAGDEGKGKITDSLVEEHINAGYEVVSVRSNGGANAGHTVEGEGGIYYDFHQIPSGVAHTGVTGVIANGYVDAERTCSEVANLKEKGLSLEERLVIGSIAHFVLPHHIKRDQNREKGKNAQGSTGSGMAFVASDKREGIGVSGIDILEDLNGAHQKAYEGLRKFGLAKSVVNIKGISKMEARELADEWAKAAERLQPYINDATMYLHEQIDRGKLVDIEAAQAFLLDIDHGKKPWTTRDNTLTAGIMAAAGLPVGYWNKTIGVYKIFPSKVGGGPFPTRILDPEVETKIIGVRGTPDGEFGVTTGRKREVGYPDLASLRRFIRIEKPSSLAFTKIDTLSRLNGWLPVCVEYLLDGERLKIAPSTGRELMYCKPVYDYRHVAARDIRGIQNEADLPKSHHNILAMFEEELETRVEYIGTGPGNKELIKRELSC
jgi:adenylosuccinate synthase